MSDQSDSQNRSEEQMDLSEGTSPSTSDEGAEVLLAICLRLQLGKGGKELQIQELINSKMGTGKYQLDKEHFPLYPDFEDNEVVMNEDDPQSVQAQEKKEKAKREKAAKMPTQEEASEYFLKTKQEQLGYLIASSLRI